MKEIASAEQLGEVVLNQWSDKRAVLVGCEETKLFLGVEYRTRENFHPSEVGDMVIFSKTPNSLEGIYEWDRVQFCKTSSKWEDDKNIKVFTLNRGRYKNRIELKAYLRDLGFNPEIIDRIFPRQLARELRRRD